MVATRRGTGEIGRSFWIFPWQQPAGEPEDRKITLDLNHFWIHRGGPTQEVKSWKVLQLMQSKLSWCKRGALRHGRFPTQAPALIDEHQDIFPQFLCRNFCLL